MTDIWSTKAREARLRDHLAYAYARAPAVREILDNAAVDPGAVQRLDDLALLPVTTKEELLRRQADDPPFGGFCAVPIEELQRVYVSPGPIYEPSGVWDNAAWMFDLLAAHGVPRTGRALISFSYHLVPAGLGLDDTLRRYGLMIVPAGVGNTEVQARILRDLAIEVFCGTPSFLVALLQRAEELGYRWGHELCLRFALIGAEAFTTALRRETARRNIAVIETYGTADVGLLGATCPVGNGFHLTNDAHVEILDPETGRRVEGGEIGEVVVTAFSTTYPLLRLGTGDLAALLPEPCPCGLPSPVLSRLAGRVGEAVKVRGMFLHPGQVDTAMDAIDGIGRYQVSVHRAGLRDELVVRIEVADDGQEGDGLPERIQQRTREIWRVRPDRVETVPVGTLPEGGKVLVDERPWDG
ncbi:MAG TPA: AMP-binding protein [Acidimicrobiia bacterium]|nr:AMP-binding protein [Acidimicrobiia bacterium]